LYVALLETTGMAHDSGVTIDEVFENKHGCLLAV
jgi:hypothetical protein